MEFWLVYLFCLAFQHSIIRPKVQRNLLSENVMNLYTLFIIKMKKDYPVALACTTVGKKKQLVWKDFLFGIYKFVKKDGLH